MKHMKSDIYYSDFARFEHDPPGHTCGLPCCREDSNVHIKQPSSAYSCMPVGLHEKILDDNFTFRRKRYGLISGRPTFSNKFFSLQNINSDAMRRQRRPLPDFAELAGKLSGVSQEGPKSPEVILTDSLENPFVLKARPGLRKGEFMCRREICLPDSPELNRKFIFSDYEIGDSLDFDDSEDGTIEYYTTTPQNAIKIDKASIKVVNKMDPNDLGFQGHANRGFSHDPRDVAEAMTSSEHYYDMLNVLGEDEARPSPPTKRLYPDLSDIQEESNAETSLVFKQKYVNTLARKKAEPKPVTVSKPVPNRYDTFPFRKNPSSTEVVDDKLKRFHLWNQFEQNADNYYEDIEFKQPEKKTPGNDVTDDVKPSDANSDENARNSFGSFGYDGDKSPSKPDKNVEKKMEVEKKSKRQDSLKDSPITLIL